MSYIITAEQLAKVTAALADAKGFMETMTDGPDDNEFLEHSRLEAVSAAKQLLLSIAPDDPEMTGSISLCMEHLYRELEGNWLAYDNGQEFNVTSEEDCPIENQDCGCHHHFDSDCKG